MSEYALEIRDLNKSYDNKSALKGIDLLIKKGEFYGFLGPNGAGKTTTINIITGLTNKTSGSVKVFGIDVVTEYRRARRLVGLSPQEPNLDFFFPADTVLNLQGGYFGMSSSERKMRTEELLEYFGLTEHRKKPFRKLSGGLKRRLLIARAMMHKPKLLILDEPTAGVDVELRKKIWDSMLELRENGTTILLTTHYIEEAEELCDKIAIINKGEIIRDGDKNELMDEIHYQVIEVTPASPVNDIPELLKEYKCRITKSKTLVFSLDKKTQSMSGLLKALVSASVEVADLKTESGRLEDLFLRLTGSIATAG